MPKKYHVEVTITDCDKDRTFHELSKEIKRVLQREVRLIVNNNRIEMELLDKWPQKK